MFDVYNSLLLDLFILFYLFFFSSRRRHTRSKRDWSSDVCSSDLLREDHRKVKRLFREFDKVENDEDENGMKEIFEDIRKELTVHAQIEEEIFYPAIRGAQEEEAVELVEEAHEEHRIVKMLVDEIGAL